MQNLEEQNNQSAVDAASNKGEPVSPEPVSPGPATASPSVMPTTAVNKLDARELTPTTAVPHNASEPVKTAHVHAVPADQASRSLSTMSVSAPASEPAAQPHHVTAEPAAATQGGAASQAPEITIDDFVKVDLRVAQVLVAERVPKADKLLRLEVDLGYEKRQILAGIAQYYEPEKLIGRKIVIVANLAPRKMRGLESNGMLLAASLPDGAPVLAGFLEEVPLGARLK
jgi:methionyl-tRNA synthetase